MQRFHVCRLCLINTHTHRDTHIYYSINFIYLFTRDSNETVVRDFVMHTMGCDVIRCHYVTRADTAYS